jgi:hypothetical protein
MRAADAEEAAEGEREAKRLTNFWFHCLTNNDDVCDVRCALKKHRRGWGFGTDTGRACACMPPTRLQLIQEHDEDVLSYLTNIRAEYLEEMNTGFTLFFDFAENPYFTDATLTKTYHLSPGPEHEHSLMYEGHVFQRAEGYAPVLHEDRGAGEGQGRKPASGRQEGLG